MAPIIEIRNLTKRYDGRTAVDGLTLTVEEGGIFGFVGPNGAGKTTAIRVMATLLELNGGDVRIAGHSVLEEPRLVRKVIGYMPDFFGVYNDMKVWEYLDFFAGCYEISEPDRISLIGDLLELFELSHRRDDFVESLSRGMKQRLSLARTLVHDPQVLILDEPASGLDPRARVEIRELLVELSRMGKTIFFSTHILSDVAEISTHVGIIEAGKLVASGPVEDLQQHLLPGRTVEITFLEKGDEAIQFLRDVPGVLKVEAGTNNGEQGRRSLQVEFMGDEKALSVLLSDLVSAGFPVLHFSADRIDLEEVFLRATKGLVT